MWKLSRHVLTCLVLQAKEKITIWNVLFQTSVFIGMREECRRKENSYYSTTVLCRWILYLFTDASAGDLLPCNFLEERLCNLLYKWCELELQDCIPRKTGWERWDGKQIKKKLVTLPVPSSLSGYNESKFELGDPDLVLPLDIYNV